MQSLEGLSSGEKCKKVLDEITPVQTPQGSELDLEESSTRVTRSKSRSANCQATPPGQEENRGKELLSGHKLLEAKASDSDVWFLEESSLSTKDGKSNEIKPEQDEDFPTIRITRSAKVRSNSASPQQSLERNPTGVKSSRSQTPNADLKELPPLKQTSRATRKVQDQTIIDGGVSSVMVKDVPTSGHCTGDYNVPEAEEELREAKPVKLTRLKNKTAPSATLDKGSPSDEHNSSKENTDPSASQRRNGLPGRVDVVASNAIGRRIEQSGDVNKISTRARCKAKLRTFDEEADDKLFTKISRATSRDVSAKTGQGSFASQNKASQNNSPENESSEMSPTEEIHQDTLSLVETSIFCSTRSSPRREIHQKGPSVAISREETAGANDSDSDRTESIELSQEPAKIFKTQSMQVMLRDTRHGTSSSTVTLISSCGDSSESIGPQFHASNAESIEPPRSYPFRNQARLSTKDQEKDVLLGKVSHPHHRSTSSATLQKKKTRRSARKKMVSAISAKLNRHKIQGDLKKPKENRRKPGASACRATGKTERTRTSSSPISPRSNPSFSDESLPNLCESSPRSGPGSASSTINTIPKGVARTILEDLEEDECCDRTPLKKQGKARTRRRGQRIESDGSDSGNLDDSMITHHRMPQNRRASDAPQSTHEPVNDISTKKRKELEKVERSDGRTSQMKHGKTRTRQRIESDESDPGNSSDSMITHHGTPQNRRARDAPQSTQPDDDISTKKRKDECSDGRTSPMKHGKTRSRRRIESDESDSRNLDDSMITHDGPSQNHRARDAPQSTQPDGDISTKKRKDECFDGRTSPMKHGKTRTRRRIGSDESDSENLDASTIAHHGTPENRRAPDAPQSTQPDDDISTKKRKATIVAEREYIRKGQSPDDNWNIEKLNTGASKIKTNEEYDAISVLFNSDEEEEEEEFHGFDIPHFDQSMSSEQDFSFHIESIVNNMAKEEDDVLKFDTKDVEISQSDHENNEGNHYVCEDEDSCSTVGGSTDGEDDEPTGLTPRIELKLRSRKREAEHLSPDNPEIELPVKRSKSQSTVMDNYEQSSLQIDSQDVSGCTSSTGALPAQGPRRGGENAKKNRRLQFDDSDEEVYQSLEERIKLRRNEGKRDEDSFVSRATYASSTGTLPTPGPEKSGNNTRETREPEEVGRKSKKTGEVKEVRRNAEKARVSGETKQNVKKSPDPGVGRNTRKTQKPEEFRQNPRRTRVAEEGEQSAKNVRSASVNTAIREFSLKRGRTASGSRLLDLEERVRTRSKQSPSREGGDRCKKTTLLPLKPLKSRSETVAKQTRGALKALKPLKPLKHPNSMSPSSVQDRTSTSSSSLASSPCHSQESSTYATPVRLRSRATWIYTAAETFASRAPIPQCGRKSRPTSTCTPRTAVHTPRTRSCRADGSSRRLLRSPRFLRAGDKYEFVDETTDVYEFGE